MAVGIFDGFGDDHTSTKASDLPFCPAVFHILILPTLKPTRTKWDTSLRYFDCAACFSDAQPVLGGDIMDKPSSPTPASDVSSDLGHERVSPVPTYPRASPATVPFTSLLSSFPTPPTSAPGSVPVAPHSPRPGGASPAHQSPPRASQQLPRYVNIDPTNPHEWNMEQVVAWLRWKGFGDNVCTKFIEHEIAGDVLLELNLCMLKELDIAAFGQRVRLSTAINELRSPSGASFLPPTYYVGHSSRHIHGSKSALQFPTEPNFVSSPETISSPLDVSWASMPNIFYNMKPGDVHEMHDQKPETGKAIDPGVTSSATKEVRNGKLRMMSLRLPPSTDSLSERFWGSQQFDASTKRVSGIQEEPEAFSDSETLRPRMSEFPKNFKNHAERCNASPSDSSHSGSKVLTFMRSTSPECSSSIDTPAKRLFDANPSQHPLWNNNGKEESTEFQSSSFDRFLADSPKPTPWHSTVDTSSRYDPAGAPRPSLAKPPTIQHPHGSAISSPGAYHSGTYRLAPPDFLAISGAWSHLHPRSAGVPELDLIPKRMDECTLRNLPQLIGEPDREGWLRQKVDRHNIWHSRYFLLKGPHLYSFYNPGEAELYDYISLKGSRIIADENADPGCYGFGIVHDIRGTHYLSSALEVTAREWMKALVKATIDRDYTKPTVSSSHIRTIPLSVAQAMSPPPRPPSPVTQDARRSALRSENSKQLSIRDPRVLMGLPSGNGSTQPEPDGHVSEDSALPTMRKSVPPLRLSRESRKLPSSSSTAVAQNACDIEDVELINWINDHIPHASVKATDLSTSLSTGLVLFRLAETFDPSQSDGLFILFAFLLENNVGTGNIRFSDVRQGNREKLVRLVKVLKAWSEEQLNLERSVKHHYIDLSRPLVGASR
ncbi:hypothetical protein BS47DRAFT_1396665 [Hydnum rufescens UP504]|uniref:Uncharacterized protein n=1 Tax=Hydnum rufescens UP504 TaxID=1448309 RepID=A0A9P6APQ6_9AGAM|nr:hypothetical protein BS47DRAFT_1396665 [Hydnum rufescens UP504]